MATYFQGQLVLFPHWVGWNGRPRCSAAHAREREIFANLPDLEERVMEPDEESLNQPAFVPTDYGAASTSLTPRRETNRAVATRRRVVVDGVRSEPVSPE